MSNVFSFCGTVGRDAEVRYLPSGQAVLNVSVANNVGFGDRQQTIWVRVAVWGKRAEGNLKDYLKKGQPVFVSGEMTMGEYTGNDGVKRTNIEVNAAILDLVGGKREGAAAPAPAQQSPHNAAKSNGYAPPRVNENGVDMYDDDVPF